VDRAPDLSQTAALADNALIHKALAGLTMMVLALSGTAVPTVMNQSEKPAEVAASPSAIASLDGTLAGAADALATAEGRLATPASAGAGAAATSTGSGSAAPGTEAGASDPAAREVQGGSRSKLFFSGRDDSSENRPGGSRQTIIHRPDDAEEGGLLTGTPAGATLDSVLSQVSQAVPLPVEATVSVPGVTGPFDAPLSATAQLPAGQSVAVQVPPALSSVLGGVLQPVNGALSGLTAGH
jgi:hypothetical protein